MAAAAVPPTLPAAARTNLLHAAEAGRQATWACQDSISVGHTPTVYSDRRSQSRPYRQWVVRLWQRRARFCWRARRIILPWMPTYRCEHGRGGWATNTGNGFYGGLQFLHSTWVALGGLKYASRADLATPLEQVLVARRHGSDGWPNCPNP